MWTILQLSPNTKISKDIYQQVNVRDFSGNLSKVVQSLLDIDSQQASLQVMIQSFLNLVDLISD